MLFGVILSNTGACRKILFQRILPYTIFFLLRPTLLKLRPFSPLSPQFSFKSIQGIIRKIANIVSANQHTPGIVARYILKLRYISKDIKI